MIDSWKKRSLNDFIENLTKYYQDSSAKSFSGQGAIDTLNKEEKKYLNDNLDLSKIVGVGPKYVTSQ